MDVVPLHLLRDVEIRDHAVLQRADGLDMARGTPDHPFSFSAHGQDGAGKGVDRDDGRLVQDHPATANVDERVRGPEVDRHIATKEPENPLRSLGTGRGGRRMLNPFGHGFVRALIQQAGTEAGNRAERKA
jgi:hypothetical protein